MAMRPVEIRDLAVGAVTVAVAATTLFLLIPFGVQNPGSIDVRALGPDFWPRIICVGVLAMGLLIGGMAIWRSRGQGNGASDPDPEVGSAESEFEGLVIGRWLTALALLAAFYLLLEPLGMVLASILVMLALMALGGERRLHVMVVLALSLPIALFIFFRYAANVFIPLGPLETWFT